jgi:hypothetical protein
MCSWFPYLLASRIFALVESKLPQYQLPNEERQALTCTRCAGGPADLALHRIALGPYSELLAVIPTSGVIAFWLARWREEATGRRPALQRAPEEGWAPPLAFCLVGVWQRNAVVDDILGYFSSAAACAFFASSWMPITPTGGKVPPAVPAIGMFEGISRIVFFPCNPSS